MPPFPPDGVSGAGGGSVDAMEGVLVVFVCCGGIGGADVVELGCGLCWCVVGGVGVGDGGFGDDGV